MNQSCDQIDSWEDKTYLFRLQKKKKVQDWTGSKILDLFYQLAIPLLISQWKFPT